MQTITNDTAKTIANTKQKGVPKWVAWMSILAMAANAIALGFQFDWQAQQIRQADYQPWDYGFAYAKFVPGHYLALLPEGSLFTFLVYGAITAIMTMMAVMMILTIVARAFDKTTSLAPRTSPSVFKIGFTVICLILLAASLNWFSFQPLSPAIIDLGNNTLTGRYGFSNVTLPLSDIGSFTTEPGLKGSEVVEALTLNGQRISMIHVPGSFSFSAYQEAHYIAQVLSAFIDSRGEFFPKAQR